MKVFDGSDHNGQGDGVLFYPGADGPLSSIRLENIADGLEDAELFRRYVRSGLKAAGAVSCQRRFSSTCLALLRTLAVTSVEVSFRLFARLDLSLWLWRRMENTTKRDELISMLVQSGDLWTDDPALLESVRREAAAAVVAQQQRSR
jgi:hypothetical protein